MLTDDQLADRIGPRLRRELADIAAPDDLPARLRHRQASQTRRSVVAAAATVAVMAGAATLAVGASGPASPAPTPATLTAWTVTTHPHGDVTVTVRALYDPAGLQRKLRQDGIPAHVAVGRHTGRACRSVEAFYLGAVSVGRKSPPKGVPPKKNEAVFTIHRAGIPRGLGLAISLSQTGSAHPKSASIRAGFKFVALDSQCTGS